MARALTSCATAFRPDRYTNATKRVLFIVNLSALVQFNSPSPPQAHGFALPLTRDRTKSWL